MGDKDDREGYCHFCCHCYTVGLQEMFTLKWNEFSFNISFNKVPKGGYGNWRVRLIMFVVILANNFGLFCLRHIGIE